MSVKTKILIVDDHPMMREGLGHLIANEPDLTICGEAEESTQAMRQIEEFRPDLVLSDLTLPGKSGLEMIKDIQTQYPEIKVLVISMHDEELYTERVLKAGARGYVMKQEGGKRILEGIRTVLRGEIFVSAKMSSKLLQMISGGTNRGKDNPLKNLTDREFEIFNLIGAGLSTAEISTKINISVKTVEVHRANVKAKLGLRSAAELLRYSVRWTEIQAQD